MPKRIVDGDGVWGSLKLQRVTPESYRAEYANLLPLALANGVFECDARKVWARVYAFNRPSVSVSDCEKMLDEFGRREIGLLFRWTAPDGKTWGYWIGIDKPGRLPAQAVRARKSYQLGPDPPSDKLAEFIKSCQCHDNSVTVSDSGSGIGSGIGIGSVEPIAQPSASLLEYPEAFENFWKAYPRKTGKGAALKSWKKIAPKNGLAERITESVAQHCQSFDWRKDSGQFIPHPATFLNQRRWEDEFPS